METKQIIILEDERIVAADIRESLQRLGYAVPAVVASGEEAIRLMDARCADLVLMDLRLEGELDGAQTARIIQERHHVPVIFLTAHSDRESIAKVAPVGAYGYLLKPYNERELYTSIEVALHKHAMEEELSQTRCRLQQSLREVEGIHRLLHFQRSMHSPREAFAEILQVLDQALSVDQAILYEPDCSGQRLVAMASLGMSTPGRLEEDPDAEVTPALSLEQTNHLVVRAFVHRQPQAREREAAVPMVDRGQCLGVIWIRRENLNDEERHLLWRLCDEIALVLRGARTNEGLDQAAVCLDELEELE